MLSFTFFSCAHTHFGFLGANLNFHSIKLSTFDGCAKWNTRRFLTSFDALAYSVFTAARVLKIWKSIFKLFFCYFFHLNFCMSSWELLSFHSYTRAEIPSERVSFLWCQNWRWRNSKLYIFFLSFSFLRFQTIEWMSCACDSTPLQRGNSGAEKKWKSQLKY